MGKGKQLKSWGGNPPADADEARQRLAGIAIDCFAEKGMRRAFMSEVARMAGVSRPTLYSYYPTKESLMFGAMALEVEDWIKRLQRRMLQFDTAQDRLVEGVLFAVGQLPKTRVLKFIADPEYVNFVAQDDPGMERSLNVNLQAIEALFELAPELREREREISEIVLRTIISFLQYQMGPRRTGKSMREFLHRRLVPAVGLQPLDSYIKSS